MTYKNEVIYVGNPDKGYALFNKTTGEYLSRFEYDNIVTTTFGVHFLYKGDENYIIVDDFGKELVFDKEYFWGALGRCFFGVGTVVNLTDNKCYLASYKGEVLSKGYDRRLVSATTTSRIYEASVEDKSAGRVLKGLVAMSGEEIVSCSDEYIPIFDNIFSLYEMVEKYGYGLIKYASDEILASDKMFVNLLEHTIKSLYTLPDSISKDDYIKAFCSEGPASLYSMRLEECFSRNIARKKSEDIDFKDVVKKFDDMIEKLKEDGVISNALICNYLKKNVQNVLERVFVNKNTFIFDI